MNDKKSTGRKILLVEDEQSLAEMYKTKFERDDFEVLHLNNGGAVLEIASKEKPDIILLDIILPKKDGFAVLEELKGEAKTKNIPVLMLTNLGQDEDIKKGKDLGAKDYIVKANSTPAQVLEEAKKFM